MLHPNQITVSADYESDIILIRHNQGQYEPLTLTGQGAAILLNNINHIANMHGEDKAHLLALYAAAYASEKWAI